MQGTWIWSLGWENPLEKGTGYPLQYSGLENSQRVGGNWKTFTSKKSTEPGDKYHACLIYFNPRIIKMLTKTTKKLTNSFKYYVLAFFPAPRNTARKKLGNVSDFMKLQLQYGKLSINKNKDGRKWRAVVKINQDRSSLMVQWLRLNSCNAGGQGLIPGQRTWSQKLQLRVHLPQLNPACGNKIKTPTCRN